MAGLGPITEQRGGRPPTQLNYSCNIGGGSRWMGMQLKLFVCIWSLVNWQLMSPLLILTWNRVKGTDGIRGKKRFVGWRMESTHTLSAQRGKTMKATAWHTRVIFENQPSTARLPCVRVCVFSGTKRVPLHIFVTVAFSGEKMGLFSGHNEQIYRKMHRCLFKCSFIKKNAWCLL